MKNHKFDLGVAEEMLNIARDVIDIDAFQQNDKRTLIILGGQPGAGKSTLIQKIRKEFSNNIFLLNADDIKHLYPKYSQLLKNDPIEAAHIVQKYSNYVIDNLKAELLSRGISVIIEGTMRDSRVSLKTINEFNDKGYSSEAYIMAINKYSSILNCELRYETDIKIYGYGRKVPYEIHDEAFDNIPKTIKKLLESKLLTNIKLYDRNFKLVSQFINTNDLLADYVSAVSKISREDVNYIKSQFSKVLALKTERNADIKELEIIHNLKLRFDKDMKNYTNKDKSKEISR